MDLCGPQMAPVIIMTQLVATAWSQILHVHRCGAAGKGRRTKVNDRASADEASEIQPAIGRHWRQWCVWSTSARLPPSKQSIRLYYIKIEHWVYRLVVKAFNLNFLIYRASLTSVMCTVDISAIAAFRTIDPVTLYQNWTLTCCQSV